MDEKRGGGPSTRCAVGVYLGFVRRDGLRKVAAVVGYALLLAGCLRAASEDVASDNVWAVLVALSTFAIGAVLGRWSVGLAALLVVVMILFATLGPCDPATAYSCDDSVDPWWPAVLTNTVVLAFLLAVGVGFGRLVALRSGPRTNSLD